MMEIRYFALDDHDVEDTGYEAGPIEVEAENLQYDLDEEDPTESPEPEVPPERSVSAVLPSGDSTPAPPKKPVARAVAPKKAAPKKAPAKKVAAKKTTVKKTTPAKKAATKKATAKKTARKATAKKSRKR